MKPSDHPVWAVQVKQVLDDSAQQLDATTLSRLNRARQAALEQRRAPTLRSWFLPAGLASACALLLAMAVWHVRTPDSVAMQAKPATATRIEATTNASRFDASDLDMVSGDDSLELYQDLEFYAWLDAQNQGSDG